MGNPFIEAYKKNGVVGAINKLEELQKTDLNCDHLTEDNITELIDTLIENGEDLNTVNENGVSLLHLWHSPEFIKKAVNAGGDINIRDKEGNTPLKNFATNASDWTDLWEEAGENLRTEEAVRNYLGMPLPEVDTQEFHDILKTYLECGADPDSGMALHSLLYPLPIWSEGILAKFMNNILKSIDLVLSYGDVNALTDDKVETEKETAFGIVCRLYADEDISDYSPLFLPVLKKLVEAGADINTPVFLKKNRSEPAISLLSEKIQQELYSLLEYKQELNRQQKEDMEIYER